MEQIAAHQGIIHKIARLYFDADVEREDFFQEVLLNAWRTYPAFAGESAFSTWLYKVGLNTALMRLRAARTGRQKILAASKVSAEDHGGAEGRDDASRSLRRAMECLDDLEKSIIQMHLEGKSYREIAAITGLNEGHVGVKINRMKQKLRARLAPGQERHGN